MFTGLSGSGKSSLAFDTIYVEGQRLYRGIPLRLRPPFLGQMDKPDVDFIEGLAGHLHRSEDNQPQSPLHRGDGHRDLRLPAAPFRPDRPIPTVPSAADPSPADGGADGGPDHGAWEGTRLQILAPVVKEAGRGYRKVLEEIRKDGSSGSGSTGSSGMCPRTSNLTARRPTPSGS